MIPFMSNRHISSALLLAAALLAQGASAQTPVRPAQFVLPPTTTENNYQLSDLAMDGAGNLSFLWSTPRERGVPPGASRAPMRPWGRWSGWRPRAAARSAAPWPPTSAATS